MPSVPYRTTLVVSSSSSLPAPTTAYVPDYMVRPFNIGIGVAVVSSGSSAVFAYNVEHTFDNTGPIQLGAPSTGPGGQNTGAMTFISSGLTWFPNSGLSGLSSNANGNYAYPVTGIRLNITAGTSNCSATMNIIQAG